MILTDHNVDKAPLVTFIFQETDREVLKGSQVIENMIKTYQIVAANMN